MKRFKDKLLQAMGKISIVDWFLLLFMLILFLYIMIRLACGNFSGNTNTVDVLVRTSAAAILGYFISGNFLKTDPSSKNSQTGSTIAGLPVKLEPSFSDSSVKSQIGFQDSDQVSQKERGNITTSSEEEISPQSHYGKIQVIVVSIIGILSLAILISARHFQDITPELTAIISQLRDFTFTCIGFLISCGKNTSQ